MCEILGGHLHVIGVYKDNTQLRHQDDQKVVVAG